MKAKKLCLEREAECIIYNQVIVHSTSLSASEGLTQLQVYWGRTLGCPFLTREAVSELWPEQFVKSLVWKNSLIFYQWLWEG